MQFESLLQEAVDEKVQVVYQNLKGKLKGLYGDNVIIISKHVKSTDEETCILAEELGHYHTTTGDILDQSKLENRKQEHRARGWAYKKLVSLTLLTQAYKDGIRTHYELAEYLQVTESFLLAAIKHYKEKHGIYCRIENHYICFEPFGILDDTESW